MKNLHLLAGCNGAVKTTAAYALLPTLLGCREFVNADEIARGSHYFPARQHHPMMTGDWRFGAVFAGP